MLREANERKGGVEREGTQEEKRGVGTEREVNGRELAYESCHLLRFG